jgi:signal transduction histidine kinase
MMLVDHAEGVLQLKARLGPPTADRRSEPIFYIGDESIAGHVASSGETYYCPNIEHDPRFRPSRTGRGFVSLLCVPVVHAGRAIAIINADATEQDWFHADQRTFVEEVATAVAPALARKISVLDALLEVSKHLARMPHQGGVNAVLQSIVDQATRALGADVVTLYQYDQARQEFLVEGSGPTVAGRLFHPEAMQTRVYSDDVPFQLVKTGQSLFVPRTDRQEFLHHAYSRVDRTHHARFVDREKINSMAALVLLHGASKTSEHCDQVVGVMFVNYRREHDFNIDERRTLATFADFAAIAIVNARNEARHVQEAKQIVDAVSGSLAHRMSRLFGASKLALANLRRTIPASNSEAHADLAIIQRQADQLFGLAEHLKRRLKSATESNSEQVSLQDTISKVLEDVSLERGGSSIEFVNYAACRRDFVYSDAVHLHQILYDLVRNSVESLQEKCAQLQANGDSTFHGIVALRVIDDETQDALELEIEDNGVGIDPVKQKKLFVPAFSTKGSLGIGLWWCQTFIRATGGELILKESMLGRGCTFMLRLPKAERYSRDTANQLPDVLIVDDDEESAAQLAKLIGHTSNCRSDVAHSRTDALKALRRRTPYALLLLDISLDDSLGAPDDGGLQVLRHINESRISSRVIFMTGHGDQYPMDRLVREEPHVLAWFNKNSAEWPGECIKRVGEALKQEQSQ